VLELSSYKGDRICQSLTVIRKEKKLDSNVKFQQFINYWISISTHLPYCRTSYVLHSLNYPSPIYLVKNAVDISYRNKYQWSPLINHITTPRTAESSCGHFISPIQGGLIRLLLLHSTSCNIEPMTITVRQMMTIVQSIYDFTCN
jgi:hypothetical protein